MSKKYKVSSLVSKTLMGVVIAGCVTAPIFANGIASLSEWENIFNSDACPMSQDEYELQCSEHGGRVCTVCERLLSQYNRGRSGFLTFGAGDIDGCSLGANEYYSIFLMKYGEVPQGSYSVSEQAEQAFEACYPLVQKMSSSIVNGIVDDGTTFKFNSTGKIVNYTTSDGVTRSLKSYTTVTQDTSYGSNLDDLLLIDGIANNDVDRLSDVQGNGISTFASMITNHFYWLLFGIGIPISAHKFIIAVSQWATTSNPQAKAQYLSDMKEPFIGMMIGLVGITFVAFVASAFGVNNPFL